MIAIVLFIFLAIWILLTKSAMKIGRHLFRRFRPDNPRAEKWGAFWGFMLAMGWVFVYWAVEAVVVRIYAAQMCRQAGITVYVTPEQWRNLTKESADNLRKNAPFSFKKMFLFPLKKIVSYSMGMNFNFLILLHYQMIYMYILLFPLKKIIHLCITKFILIKNFRSFCLKIYMFIHALPLEVIFPLNFG